MLINVTPFHALEESEMGNVDGEGYVLRILPEIDQRIGELHTWMHDNASLHTSLESLREQARQEIVLIPWPACSPDLSPIDTT
jgi:hypothetical protein